MATRDLIAVDIGNTFVKLQAGRLADSPWNCPAELRLATADLKAGVWRRERLAEWLSAADVKTPARWVVAAVHGAAEGVLGDWVRSERPADAYYRLAPLDIPLVADVEAPERVGIDRLLNALAANQLREVRRAAVIVDAGSAVTVDAVSAEGRFLGGAILPGLNMAASALSRATDQLPLVGPDPRHWPMAIGRSTHDAIRSGVLWGTLGAVRELVARLGEQLGQEPHLFVTGGDAACLEDLSRQGAEFRPNLVLAGIRLLESRLPAEL